ARRWTSRSWMAPTTLASAPSPFQPGARPLCSTSPASTATCRERRSRCSPPTRATPPRPPPSAPRASPSRPSKSWMRSWRSFQPRCVCPSPASPRAWSTPSLCGAGRMSRTAPCWPPPKTVGPPSRPCRGPAGRAGTWSSPARTKSTWLAFARARAGNG
ncbi:hypothetical protein QBZ16_003706, partial [Prototheca wickerhamii]